MKGKIIILLLFFSETVLSQDIHFSQNFANRIYSNPAKVGQISENDYRLSFQRKSQWQEVSVPFSTFSTSFENRNIFNNINIGLEFFNDKSGDSKLTHNQLNLALSKNYKILKVNTFSVGAVVGVGQKTIDYTNLIF